MAASVAGLGSFSSGEQGAIYTITVKNSGTGTTSGTVTVVDPPTGFTVTGISGSGWTCTLATLTCTNSGSLAAGQSFSPITVMGNVTSANGTPVTVPLNLSGGGAPAVTVTPVPSVAVAAVALSIAKSHTGNFTQGQQGATYAVKVSNGASAGTTSGAVTVTEIPPTGLTVTGMAGSSWACVVATLSCTRSDALTGGSSYDPITVTVNVAANAGSPLTNQASVSGGNQTTAVPAASDSTIITVPPALQISKSHLGSFTQGQVGATYSVTVSNGVGAGPTSGTVTVTEIPPSGLSVTGMAGTNWACVIATLTCTRSDALAGGASYDAITVTANVNATASSPQVNKASVSGGGSAAASATDSTTIIAVPALSIAKTHTGNFAMAQQGATYTLTVSNLAGQPATSGLVTVKEIPPSGLSVSGMAGGTGSSWACVVATLTCTRSDALAGGASYDPITVTVTVGATATTPQVNTATVSGGSSANNSATDSTTIVASSCSTLSLLGNESLLSGTYIARIDGWKDSGGPTQATAAFIANGTGGVTSGEMDSGTVVVGGAAQSAPILTTISSGCYQIGTDDRGKMIWNFTGGGSVTYAISVSPLNAVGNDSYLVEFDDANPGTSPGTRSSGSFTMQTGGPFTLASFSGPFAFGSSGYFPNSGNTNYTRGGTIGRFDVTTTGVVTGGAEEYAFTSPSGTQTNLDNQSFTGTFGPPDGFGRGILTLNFTSLGTLGATTYHFAYYLSDANDMSLQSIDIPDTSGHSLQSGSVTTQFAGPYAAFALNGNAVFSAAGADLSPAHGYTVTAVGQISGDSVGGASSMVDGISNGVAFSNGTIFNPGGTFAVSSNGMGVLTLGSSTGQTFSVAMRGLNSAYMLQGTASSPGNSLLTGAYAPQKPPVGGFVDTTLKGAYVLGTTRQTSPNSFIGVGSVMTPTPQTNPATFSGLNDDSDGGISCKTSCLFASQPFAATYTIDPNGRIVITPTNPAGGGLSVGWLVKPGKVFDLPDINNKFGTIGVAIR